MKKTNKVLAIIALVAAIGITVAACGGGSSDPKALAKEGIALMQEMEKLYEQGKMDNPSDPAVVSHTKKTNALNEKVAKLSDADRKIMEDELERLFK
ncbi:MAG: hypothetical protein LBH44_00220 [Treponema sp.]|jgi:hypothetical protein|nr:hypothetical protein [Treponema sp.]